MIVLLVHPMCGTVKGVCNHTENGNLTELLSKHQPAVYEEKTIAFEKNTKNAYNC